MSIILAANELTESDVRWYAALPFVVSALSVVGTWLGSYLVRSRTRAELTDKADRELVLRLDKADIDQKLSDAGYRPDAKIVEKIQAVFKGAKIVQFLPSDYHPGPLQQRFDRDTDAATSFASGIILIFTALVIMPEIGRGIVLLIALLGTIASFAAFVFVFNASIGAYSRTIIKGVSSLSLLILVANLVLACVAYHLVTYTPVPPQPAT